MGKIPEFSVSQYVFKLCVISLDVFRTSSLVILLRNTVSKILMFDDTFFEIAECWKLL